MKDEKKTKNVPFGKNKNYVPLEQLTDTPSRMFRHIMDKMGVNAAKWKSYMDEYLRWIHPDDSGTPLEVKKARGTSLGNAQSAYFCSRTLSFNKLITGLKILKLKRVTFKIECETETGEVFDVSETTILRRSRLDVIDDKE